LALLKILHSAGWMEEATVVLFEIFICTQGIGQLAPLSESAAMARPSFSSYLHQNAAAVAARWQLIAMMMNCDLHRKSGK